ncbi:DUF1326 domain-containing protein [Luteipulveratus halotolerans]|uniref:DUF1326 domain-containing protein n=1 Tax=Luteipulveratus halotolerans TaxID=1631356 RepID=UPI000682D536|nr:DUF1326 domain-containing protein [Luteipulveratus halotolerans]
MRYELTGTFLETCNCKVVCPCWVDESPDEDHCTGVFAWTFDEGSRIGSHDVGGHSVVSVTVHSDGRRGGANESAIYVDERLGGAAAAVIERAFAGRAGGPLAELAPVTGDVVASGTAKVAVEHEATGWTLTVHSGAARLVNASGSPKHLDASAHPLTLAHTALADELGTGADPVVAQISDNLEVNVSALPGAPVDIERRSGMTGRFRYRHDGRDDDVDDNADDDDDDDDDD